MTVPALAALIGVPTPLAMSIPGCSTPHRYPNPDVTVPLAGQATPEPDAFGAAALGAAACRLRISAERLASSRDRAATSEVTAAMRSFKALFTRASSLRVFS